MAGTGTEIVGSISEEIRNEEIRRQAALDRNAQQGAFNGQLAPGTVIDGFTIQELFNTSGGEAELYFCERDGVRHVFKLNNSDAEVDDEIMKKLKSLRNPYVMSLVGYGKRNNYPYSILEFAKGGTLSDRVESTNKYKYLPLSEEKAEEAVKEVVDAFKVLHGLGIIHRDIKPENLFYKSVKDGVGSNILIGDFGIASLFQADEGMTSHYTEHYFGTRGYEAPEMYHSGTDEDTNKRNWRISSAIDYYALGITLWVLLTGLEPFVDEKKGGVLPLAQVRRNATNNQTAEILIHRAPELSGKMRKLIRGLLVKRQKERWGYEQVMAHLAGKDVTVFEEPIHDMLPLNIGGKERRSFIEISRALMENPEEGRKLVFGGGLIKYMYELIGEGMDVLEDTQKLDALIEKYSSEKKEDEGLYAIAYTLTPNLPYVLRRYTEKVKDENGNEVEKKMVDEIQTRADIWTYLENNPALLIPALRDPSLGFYAYIDVMGYGESVGKVRDVVNNTKSDLKLAPRLQIAFQENVITPFQDKVHHKKELKSLEQLEKLDDYLRERLILFIEMKRDDVTAWIENLSGKDLDVWLSKYKTQKERLRTWGLWKSFSLFLEGKDIQVHEVFTEGEGAKRRFGLKSSKGEIVQPAVWEFVLTNSPVNRYIVKKDGKWGVINGTGTTIIPFNQDIITVLDEERGLYQCRDADSGVWNLYDERQNVLWTGKSTMTIAAAPGKPFDVLYDEEHYYNSKTFKPINKGDAPFEVVASEEGNYVWQMGEDGCTVCTGDGKPVKGEDGKPLEIPPYTGFRTREDAIGVMVLKNGNWGLATPDGSKEIIPCTYADIRCGGSYYALFMPGRSGGILCEIVKGPGGDYEKKERNWLKFESSGKVDILPTNGGNALISFRSVANMGLDYDGTKNFTSTGKLACLGDEGLLWFDIATGKTEKRSELINGEAKVILPYHSGTELHALLQFLKTQAAYEGMNRLIDAAYETDPKTNSSWAAEKSDGNWLKILSLIDKNHTDGLSRPYDKYVSWMGAESMKTGNYTEAYQYYAQAAALNKNNAGYQADCGAAHYYLGDYAKSAEFYKTAATLTSIKDFSAQYLAAMGSSLFSAGKHMEAMGAFSQAIMELGAKATGEIYSARAACCQKLSQGDKARADIAAAAKAPPKSGKEKVRGIPLPKPGESAVNIAQVAASRNISTITKALETLKAEGSISAMNALIDASYKQFKSARDEDNAVQILKKLPAETQGLENPPWWYDNQIGLYYFLKEKFTEALSYFEKASRLYPKEPSILYNAGITCCKTKNYSKAADLFTRAEKMGYTKASEELARLRRERRI